MRLLPEQQRLIKQIALELAGAEALVMIFGSRVEDTARGGDLDVFIEVREAVENPAWLIASLAARFSRLLEGRRVDVLLSAPNLQYPPIHALAKATGVVL